MELNKLVKLNKNIINLLNKIRQGKLILYSYLDQLSYCLVDDNVSNKQSTNDDFAKILIREKKEQIINRKILADEETVDKIYRVKIILANDVLFQNIRGFLVLKRAEEIGQLYNSLPAKGIIEIAEITKEIDLILGSDMRKKKIKRVFSGIIGVYKVKVEELINKDDFADNIELGKCYGLL